jgi:hypothetical protein
VEKRKEGRGSTPGQRHRPREIEMPEEDKGEREEEQRRRRNEIPQGLICNFRKL